MDLHLDIKKAEDYSNKSQIARVLTESWVKNNSYCPNCGSSYLNDFENNKPVADFYCPQCVEQYELKAKKAIKVGENIADGAYKTMIERIQSENNPHFFFLTYNNIDWMVTNFLVIPKYYFVPEIIKARKPLKKTARRAGWTGCYIDITNIPKAGRIYIVENSKIIPIENVSKKWNSTRFLEMEKNENKGWILDIMSCVDSIPQKDFSLKQMYQFEEILRVKYPNNNFIRDKIRQQLQVLRNKGLIEFIGRGHYRKLTYENI